MRLSLVLGAAAAAFYFAAPSQEAKANYCAHDDEGSTVCGFVTPRQCEEARTGSADFCVRDRFATPTAQARTAPAKKPAKAAR